MSPCEPARTRQRGGPGIPMQGRPCGQLKSGILGISTQNRHGGFQNGSCCTVRHTKQETTTPIQEEAKSKQNMRAMGT